MKLQQVSDVLAPELAKRLSNLKVSLGCVCVRDARVTGSYRFVQRNVLRNETKTAIFFGPVPVSRAVDSTAVEMLTQPKILVFFTC